LREIVFDTETTGLSPASGDRVVEIGCVEIVNRFPTGRTYHTYLNPERDMPDSAFQVHGLSIQFLTDKPLFADIAETFLDFVGDDPLIAHNAEFDISFLNMEFARIKKPPLEMGRVINTLLLARRKHPAGPNRLDDLCVRYKIDNSKRELHGALLDAQLLAEVYAELVGGRQAALSLGSLENPTIRRVKQARLSPRPVPLASMLQDNEKASFNAFIDDLGKDAIWKTYQ
jgi:DNA polymerase-3 subunit epsilon